MKQEPLQNFINQFKLKPNIKQKIKISHDILITQNTINEYMKKHSNVNEIYFKSIKSTLQKIRKNEKVVLLDNTKIYFHTYRILHIIEQYINILDYYNSENYKKYSFAKNRSDSSKVKREYYKLQVKEFDIYSYTFVDKLKAKLLEQYINRKELVDIVLNFYTIFPQSNINYEAMSSNELLIDMIQKVFSHFSSTYISSEDIIYKSLMIVLNAYLKTVMKMNSSYTKKITDELLHELFNFKDTTNSSTMLDKIYISGRIHNFPIFKNSSKKEIYSIKLKNEFTTFIRYIQKDFLELENVHLNIDNFFNENPINAYFNQYPIEFMHKIG
nr:hypothetical protein [uncultured Sulfurimonas sp.]